MTVAAARALTQRRVCFVGIGLPSAACNLARLTHAPRLRLIYESGTLETKPDVLPLSIGDGELCDTALTTVSVPEISATGCKADESASDSSAARRSIASAISTAPRSADMPHQPSDCQAAAAPARSRLLRSRVHHHAADAPRLREQAGFHDLARTRAHRSRTAGIGDYHGRSGPDRVGSLYDEAGTLKPRSSRWSACIPESLASGCANRPRGLYGSPRISMKRRAPDRAELDVLRELNARTAAAHANRRQMRRHIEDRA